MGENQGESQRVLKKGRTMTEEQPNARRKKVLA